MGNRWTKGAWVALMVGLLFPLAQRFLYYFKYLYSIYILAVSMCNVQERLKLLSSNSEAVNVVIDKFWILNNGLLIYSLRYGSNRAHKNNRFICNE